MPLNLVEADPREDGKGGEVAVRAVLRGLFSVFNSPGE